MTESVLNRYDSIAQFYDQLARMVFGDQIFNSQIHFLSSVPDNSNVLIIGGGTGLITRELLKLKPHCRIIYIEASAKMIAIAKTNNLSSIANIVFVHGTENDIPERNYDVVITNYFLDLFSQKELEVVLRKIKARLASNAIWLASDFQTPKTLWQKLVLAFMYRFFSLITKLKNQRLPDWFEGIKTIGFIELKTKEFASGFMKASVLKRVTEQ